MKKPLNSISNTIIHHASGKVYSLYAFFSKLITSVPFWIIFTFQGSPDRWIWSAGSRFREPIIIYYLKGYFESAGPGRSGLQSEFLTKGKLVRQLCNIFNDCVKEDKITAVVEYLFENRIIRKSIINDDDDRTFYCLEDNDYLYLTCKGERLLEMLESDSVLLEIYREDICREYLNEDDYKSSAELVMENKRGRLFEDILTLTKEIYFNEDQYQKYVVESGKRSAFYEIKFPLTMKVMDGVYKSITRAQNLEKDERNRLLWRFDELKGLVQERICEMEIGLGK